MSSPGRSISVLLVEDNDIDATMVRRASSDISMADNLDVVTDGDDALAYLRRSVGFADAPRPNLVLLDLNLPGISGMEVLDEMKADPELRNIPVVILTSSELEDDVVAAYDRQGAAYVTKPVGIAGYKKVLSAIECFWSGVVTFPSATA